MNHHQTPNGSQIVIRNLVKAYGDNIVLDGISLDVKRSEIACLIGPSGSGKSTLLRTINGLATVDSGTVDVCGIRVTDPGPDLLRLRRQVGMIFQSYNLFPHLTVLDNITLAPLEVLKEPRSQVEERARFFLDKVRLAGKEKAYPGELSGGQQQRVAIARSLAMQPDVMMFDEVTAALDPETVKEVLTTIKDVAASGVTCLIVTHEMRFAREIASVVHFTDGGRIVESGAPDKIFTAPDDARTRTFLERIL